MKALFLASAVFFTSTLFAQLGGLGGLGDKLKKKTPISNLLEGKAPITTSFSDVKQEGSQNANQLPVTNYQSMLNLQRTPNGGFVLQPGTYTYQAQSYCLKAGTQGPSKGAGYMYAPPMGPAEDAVMSIVRNSVNHPEIHQHDIQVLLWAIIARAKFEDLQPSYKATAARLLTPRQLAMLNRSALDLLGGNSLRESLPEPLKTIMEAEAQLRQMLTSPTGTFADMERVAVLAGLLPNKDDIESGRWSLHPDGYYVRYLPTTYSSTKVEIYVPQGSPSVGKEFDPATHIAVPASTSRQRLIQSGRPQEVH